MRNYHKHLFLYAKGDKFWFARMLRRNSTDFEHIMWQVLRNRKINGFKFRRQHPLLIYIADFYCHEAKLIIEIDGDIHDTKENKVYDRHREKELNKHGLTVLRFQNDDVLYDLPHVINRISLFLNDLCNTKNMSVKIQTRINKQL
ncbi:MAG: DUF559 domain-containing protein [Sphingobacteriales bacterium]|nr:MAG: DUF559 domain-containing protein [Sphingobacteriales bacterium]